jgi:hypothetical protein
MNAAIAGMAASPQLLDLRGDRSGDVPRVPLQQPEMVARANPDYYIGLAAST